MITTITLLILLDKNEQAKDGLKEEISTKSEDISWISLAAAAEKTIMTTVRR